MARLEGRHRPQCGERRVAPLLLRNLRTLLTYVERTLKYTPPALRKDGEKQSATLRSAIAHLEANPAQPRKVRERVSYLVELPGAAPATVSGADALAAAVGRSASYLQKRLSQGSGVAQLQRNHPETGNPDVLVITRLGTSFASSQEPCQKPKIGTSEQSDSAPSNSVDD